MISNMLTLLAAGALLTGATAFAQEPGSTPALPDQQTTSQNQQSSQQSSQQPSNSTTPQSSARGTQTNPSQKVSSSESTDLSGDNIPQTFADDLFLRSAFENGVAEAEMGRLAALLSQSGDVQQFGRSMALIHEVINDKLQPMALRLGVMEPKGLPKQEKGQIEKMRTLSGPSFDAAFVKAMMKDQQRDLECYKDEAKQGQDPAVQQLARTGERILTRRLQVLQQLAQNHNLQLESEK